MPDSWLSTSWLDDVVQGDTPQLAVEPDVSSEYDVPAEPDVRAESDIASEPDARAEPDVTVHTDEKQRRIRNPSWQLSTGQTRRSMSRVTQPTRRWTTSSPRPMTIPITQARRSSRRTACGLRPVELAAGRTGRGAARGP